MELVNVFKSKICWAVMVIGMVVAMYIVKSSIISIPDPLTGIAIIGFVILFPVSLACNIRLIKSRYREFKAVGKHGILSFILYVIGISSLQTCLVSGFCGVNAGLSLAFLILPSSAAHFFMDYSNIILFVTDIALLVSLVFMKCFENKVHSIKFSSDL